MLLKIGRKSINGRLIDTSAGGFAVQVAAGVVVATGMEVEMRSCDGVHLAQVVRVEDKAGAICLGLERLRDDPLPEANSGSKRPARRVTNPLFLGPVVFGVLSCTATLLVVVMGPDEVHKNILAPASQRISLWLNSNSGGGGRVRHSGKTSHPSADGESGMDEPLAEVAESDRPADPVDASSGSEPDDHRTRDVSAEPAPLPADSAAPAGSP